VWRRGTCGKCKVKILKGSVDVQKHPKLSQWEADEGFRLACLTTIHTDIDVEIPIESQVDKSVLAIKEDRGAHKYLLAPQDIYQLVKDGTWIPPCSKDTWSFTPLR